jgi:hypothetical protein
VLRSKHANVMVSATDGTLYFPPGGGITSSGMSPNVLSASDDILDRLQERQKWCKANGQLLAQQVERATGRRPEAFRLRFDGFEESGAVIVIDDDNRARFRFD